MKQSIHMNAQTAGVVVVAIFAVIVIAAVLRYRRNVKVGIKGPGGLGLDLEGSGDAASDRPGVKLSRATSRTGSVVAEDRTGRGTEASDLDAHGDVRVSSAPPDPKGRPPA